MTEQQQVELGAEARRVLESAAYREAWAAYEAKLIDEFRRADPRETNLLSTIRRELQALQTVQKNLAILIADGTTAAMNLKHKRTIADRARMLINN